MENLKKYLLNAIKSPKNVIILLLLLCILYLQFCNKVVKTDVPVTVKHPIEVKTKTVVDTVYLPKRVVIEKIRIDTVPVIKQDGTKVYTNTVEDSILTAKITAHVTGELTDLSLEYTPKFPKYINRTDSVFVVKTVEKPVIKRYFSIGFETGTNLQKFNFRPIVSYLDKKNNTFSLSYNLVDKSVDVGISKRIQIGK